jgi:hypothetical protein
MNAQTKAARLGLRASKEPGGKAAGERTKRPTGLADRVELLGREVPVQHTPVGLRAASAGRIDTPEAAQRYLESKFGEALGPTRAAFETLAASLPPSELAARAFQLYEAFRPAIPPGARGWGAKGVLDLAKVRSLARPERRDQ